MTRYDELSDEEVIKLIRHGDDMAQEYLLNRYKNLVRLKARTYFMAGADKEDIIQEGMIGLYKAIRDFQTERGVMFYIFAELCVTRQIITAIKTASRRKHMPLNSSVSLNRAEFNPLETSAATDAASKALNPEELFIGREGKSYIEACLERVLSEMECRVLTLFLKGKSYSEIASIIERDEKSIDNALQRVRRKLEKVLERA